MLYSCLDYDNMLSLYERTLPIKIFDPDALGIAEELIITTQAICASIKKNKKNIEIKKTDTAFTCFVSLAQPRKAAASSCNSPKQPRRSRANWS